MARYLLYFGYIIWNIFHKDAININSPASLPTLLLLISDSSTAILFRGID